MKKNVVVIIAIIVSLIACQQPKPEIDAIDIGYNDHMRIGDIILAKDSIALISLLDTAQQFSKYKRTEMLFPKTHIVNQEALRNFAEFIEENCNTIIDKEKARRDIYFTVGIFSDGRQDWCYYYLDNDGILNYFEKMLTYLNTSEYKEDLKILIPSVKVYIENCKKIKQYGKDDWKNH